MSVQIRNASPTETWSELSENADTLMVDVRTKAEWSFVGITDLSDLNKQTLMIEWKEFPTMATNENFASQLNEILGGSAPSKIFFLCRSGVRSLAAAALMSEIFIGEGKSIECVNVSEGFEGDLDNSGHRGELNGWKSHGLAWRQS